jgi:NADH-quinone oxidoreductase subunit F
MRKVKSVSDLEGWKEYIISKQKQYEMMISVCGGTGCHAYGCKKVRDQFGRVIKKNGLDQKIRLKFTGCRGLCERGPIVTIQPQGIFYQRVQEKDVPLIISETIEKGKVLEHLLYDDLLTKQKVTSEKEIPFYRAQQRLVLGKNGLIDPAKIEDYIATEGYRALAKAIFEMNPDQIIHEIKASGLRGRGGAGYLTGNKWENCRKAPSDGKYIICNCDEGDPGAYMDRSLMEGNPHSVLEGMIIGAYAIGANQGFIYVRHEYPLACKNAEIAITQAKKQGFSGRTFWIPDSISM